MVVSDDVIIYHLIKMIDVLFIRAILNYQLSSLEDQMYPLEYFITIALK